MFDTPWSTVVNFWVTVLHNYILNGEAVTLFLLLCFCFIGSCFSGCISNDLHYIHYTWTSLGSTPAYFACTASEIFQLSVARLLCFCSILVLFAATCHVKVHVSFCVVSINLNQIALIWYFLYLLLFLLFIR